MPARIALLVALALTVLVYWTGLSGPFMFDDAPNLNPVQSWLTGDMTWQSVMFGNQSGVMGRPISMASFLLSAELGGHTPYSYKLGNLIVHLLCGLVGWQVMRRLFAQDDRLKDRADLLATVVTAIWLLHPIHVSTVLYSVQRMAQLSSLFVLVSLWVYLLARQHLAQGRTGRALFGLFALFPLSVLAGLLSKENAVVAPALCLVIELAYFLGTTEHKRIRQLFFGVFLLLPGVLAVGAMLLRPDRFFSAYSERDFTLIERLLSQSRALMDYIGTMLIPRTPLMGLYTDDFEPSRGLLDPATTLPSILALLLISAAAVILRKRAASFFAGWFFFLVAHAMESSIFPLELYFEHRNYLPGFGLILAIVGLVALVPKELPVNVFTPRQLGLLLAGGFIASLAFATGGRANVWQAEGRILEQSLKHHPDSRRAQLARANIARRQGNITGAYDAFADLLSSKNQRSRMIGRLSWLTLDCMNGMDVPSADLQRVIHEARPSLSPVEVSPLRLLARVSKDRGGCGQLTDSQIADGLTALIDKASPQTDKSRSKWLTRFLAAEVLMRNGRIEEAQKQAELAWNASGNLPVGALLSQIYATRKMRAEAEQLVAILNQRMGPYDKVGQGELAKTRALLNQR